MKPSLVVFVVPLVLGIALYYVAEPSVHWEADSKETTDIDTLLSLAEQDIGSSRLTTPKGNNAYYRYKLVLKKDPNNKRAVKGLEKIVDQYISFAKIESKRGSYNKAIRYLEKGSKIIPNSKKIQIARQRILKRENNKKQSKRIVTTGSNIFSVVIDSSIRDHLDEHDEQNAQRVLESNTHNKRSVWSNPRTGAYVSMVPTRTYAHTKRGQYCREYQARVTVSSKQVRVHGTACRNSRGFWKNIQ